MVATIKTAPATKTPFLSVSQEKFSAKSISRYLVWYAFCFAPAITHASATRNVNLQISMFSISYDESF